MRILRSILRQMIWHPFRHAVVDDFKAWKNVELYIASLHVARAIERMTDRDKIGIMLPTSGLFPAAIIATWMLGRTIVPLNYLVKRDDLEYMIADAKLDVVITVGKMLEFIGGAPGKELPDGVKALKLDEMKFKGIPPLRRAKRSPDDFLAALLYTSGTSSRPKGVMLTAGNLVSNVEQCCEFAEFDGSDVMLGVLPQFHSFGLTVLTLCPLSAGCKAVYTARFMPKKIIGLMREHRPSVFVAIPSMYSALLSVKDAGPEDFKSIKFLVSGAEPLSPTVFDGYRERFNVTLKEGYGLTETSPVANWLRPREEKRKSVGKPLPRVEEKIVGPNGERLGPNEDGEICIKGPNVMKGYYNLPDATKEVFDEEGYFRTGDMGRFDEDGFLYITGRIKEMLIIGGENVFPREIEEVIEQHESVHAAAVIGAPDDLRGEVAVAFVEMKEGAAFDERSIRSFCREQLPQYKVPRDIRVLEQLPRNPTGKVLRRELQKMLKSES